MMMGRAKHDRHRPFSPGVLLLGLAMLAAFAPAARAADPIRIGVVRSMGGSPSIVAKAKGMFAAQGLDAELLYFESAQPIAVAVASGDCDFGSTGMTAAFFNLASQGALRIIGAGTWEHSAFPSVGMLVSNQAYAGGLHGFKDLGGHSVAITQLGTPLQYFVVEIAEKFTIDPKSIRFLALQSNGNVASALAGGQADTGVQTSAPIAAIVAKGDARLLGWMADVLPPRQGEVLFASARLAKEQPDIVRRFMIGLRAGEAYVHDAFVNAKGERAEGPTASDVVRLVGQALDQPADTIKQGIPYFDPQSRVSVEDIGAVMNWYKSQNMLKTDVDARALVDQRFAIEMPAR
jgi:NitT/TauT family transport system substrate-binding protein